LLGCAASEESVQADFEDFVAERVDCEADADCNVGSFGCPLGCSVAYNADYEDEISAEAERLIKKYERGGRSCEYGCVAAGRAVCDAGVCTFEE
jgi:hypothetical protein